MSFNTCMPVANGKHENRNQKHVHRGLGTSQKWWTYTTLVRRGIDVATD